jgi:hypothetical protein
MGPEQATRPVIYPARTDPIDLGQLSQIVSIRWPLLTFPPEACDQKK